MIEKIMILLAFLALAKADTTGTYFTPATSVSSAYPPIYHAPNNKARATPAPIYEEETDQEMEVNYRDRIRQDSVRSFTTIYPNSFNFYAHNTDGATLAHTIPSNYGQTIGSSISYNPTYTLSSPLTATTISGPVTYTTHTHSTPFELRSHQIPLTTKSSGLSYNSHTPIIQNEAIKTSIYDNGAPAVSHMTFTGLGATYTW